MSQPKKLGRPISLKETIMNVGIPGSMSAQLRPDGTPFIEYTRDQLAMRTRNLSFQIASLAEEQATIANLLHNYPDAKTFIL